MTNCYTQAGGQCTKSLVSASLMALEPDDANYAAREDVIRGAAATAYAGERFVDI